MLLWPVQCSMDHRGSCHVGKQIYGSLNFSILPLGTNSAQPQSLVVLGELFSEGLADIDAIVRVVGLNSDTQVVELSLKVVFGDNGVSRIQRHLQFSVDVGRVSIDKDGSATVAIPVRFLACCVEEPASHWRFQLIAKHTLARGHATLDQVAGGVRVLGGDGGSIRLPLLFPIDAGSTERVGPNHITVNLGGRNVEHLLHCHVQNSIHPNVSKPGMPQQEQLLIN